MQIKPIHLGPIIRERRRTLNLSQKKLAQLMGYKNGQYVSNMERGLSSLPIRGILAITIHLRLPMVVLKEALVNDYTEALEFEFNKELGKL